MELELPPIPSKGLGNLLPGKFNRLEERMGRFQLRIIRRINGK